MKLKVRLTLTVIFIVFTSIVWGANEEASKPVEEFLHETGNQLNCYFTVEYCREPKLPRDKESQDFASVHADKSPKTIDECVAVLQRQLPGVTVRRDKSRVNVVHLIDNRIKAIDGYPLNAKATMKFLGNLSELDQTISRMQPRLFVQDGGLIMGGVAIGSDETTKCDINIRDGEFRDILTAAIPRMGYARIAWTADTWKDTRGVFVTTYMFNGPEEVLKKTEDRRK